MVLMEICKIVESVKVECCPLQIGVLFIFCNVSGTHGVVDSNCLFMYLLLIS